ncbi:MAG: phosphate regulon transcriptional regulator PhoB [Halofilum sp. (in: g-proteobacteria)]|nr:phosphate regulon transcriptional regulator PhoB [Halofilum sp. (in: g-proteobacteria)]
MTGMQATILLVEDETEVREMVTRVLSREGFDMLSAADAPEGWRRIAERVPDLMLVDWMLPSTSGIEFVRQCKRDELTAEVPVIMLTARAEENDRVRGLETGADDYVTKPFSPRELAARIRAVLRRTSGQDSEGMLTAGRLSLSTVLHRVYVDDEPIDIGPTEFRLLRFFMSHPERVYSRAQLLDQVWSREVFVEERTVDVHVLRLRKLLKPHGLEGAVQTVRGVGYRFSME